MYLYLWSISIVEEWIQKSIELSTWTPILPFDKMRPVTSDFCYSVTTIIGYMYWYIQSPRTEEEFWIHRTQRETKLPAALQWYIVAYFVEFYKTSNNIKWKYMRVVMLITAKPKNYRSWCFRGVTIDFNGILKTLLGHIPHGFRIVHIIEQKRKSGRSRVSSWVHCVWKISEGRLKSMPLQFVKNQSPKHLFKKNNYQRWQNIKKQRSKSLAIFFCKDIVFW